MQPNSKIRLFPAQEDSEQILKVLRKHWFCFFLYCLIGFMMLVPFVWVFVYLSTITVSPVIVNLALLAGSMYLLMILGLMIYGFIDYYLDVYIVTDRRLVRIAQNGFFKREIAEVDLRQIQDVNAKVEGIAATLFHFGNVYIQNAADLPNFIFESIPHPYETSKKILDLHQAVLNHKKPNQSLKMDQIWQEESSEPDTFIAEKDHHLLESPKEILAGNAQEISQVKENNQQKTPEERQKKATKNSTQKPAKKRQRKVAPKPISASKAEEIDLSGELHDGEEVELL